MRKALYPLIALLFASQAFAAVGATATNDSPAGLLIKTKYLASYEVFDADSMLGNGLDTTQSFPTNLFGDNAPFPDVTTFYFEFSDKDAATALKADSVLVKYCQTSSNKALTSAYWVDLWANADFDTANSSGDQPGACAYTLTAAQEASCLPHSRLVIDFPATGAAADTIGLKIIMYQAYTGWKDQ